MKLPITPPRFSVALQNLLSQANGAERFRDLTARRLGPAPGGQYKHWDTFRHTPPLTSFTAQDQWVAVKMARQALYTELPIRDLSGTPFQYALPAPALEMLHRIDRNAGGNIQGNEQVTNTATRDTYLFKSIVEEAITSSQLEGASTTRKVAKAMIQEARAPRNRSERMILNNYEAMLYVRRFISEPLTPAIVMELQRLLTDGTLDEPDGAGRFRRSEEDIVIEDETGSRLHTPPPAGELEARMQSMCDFANATNDTEFIPPAVRATLLHFWLAYDHPFVDGNGRTARALFYWSMARQGYWLCEYVSISRILKKARGQYARSYLYTETDENDVTYFLLHQMRVLLRAIDDLHLYLARKAKELDDVESLAHRASSFPSDFNKRQLALIGHALKTPTALYTVESHRLSHGASYETARTDLMKLASAGLLQQRKVGKAFVYSPVADIRRRLGSK